MLNGIQLKLMDKSQKDTNRNVFIFNDTDELRKLISEYDNFIKIMEDRI